MSLRRQLLLVSLLLLALPWGGCQFVREIESGLRASQARALMATAEAMATALRDRADLLYPDTAACKAAVSGYLETLAQKLITQSDEAGRNFTFFIVESYMVGGS